MRKIVLLLIIVTLCFSAKAEQIDTCKIKVEKTDNGFKISAASKNVFVRQGNKLDPKNYVFLTDTLVEILCNDTNNVINLQDYHQEGTVTCWFQKPNEPVKQDKPGIKDKNPYHKLAPVERRHWLKFNSMDVGTQIGMVISSDNVQSSKIDFRKCGGWTGEQLRLSKKISNQGDDEVAFRLEGDSIMTTSALKLKADDTIQKFTLFRTDKKWNMVVTKVYFDQTEIPFSIYYNDNDNTSLLQSDDIMHDTEIVIDTLLNKQLEGGSHHISYICTVLTKEGPKEIKVDIPIEVESESNIVGIIYYILSIVIALIILGLAGYYLWNKTKKRVKVAANSEVKGNLLGGSNEEDKTSQSALDNDQANTLVSSTDTNGIKEPSTDPDEEILNLLKKQFETEDKAEIIQKLKKNKELKKEIVNSIIGQWNAEHPENPVDNSQFNINSFLNIIAKGYISPTGKAMLEKYADKYKIQNEELGAKSIEDLHTAIYKEGRSEGEASTKVTKNGSDQMSEILNKRIRELSTEKIRLEQEISDWEEKYNKLQGINQKSQEYVKKINEENEGLYHTCEEQGKKIAELQQSQSQKHVNQLEKNIADLNKEIATAQKSITQKNSTIAEEKEHVKKLTIQKEEFEAQLKDKDKEIAKKQTAHETALKDQKDQYEAKLTQQQEEAKAALKKKEEEYQKALEKLKKDQDAKVAKLNATIKELGASANVGRDQAIEDAEKLLKTIASDLGTIENSVKAVVNQSPIFVNSINNIFSELQRTQEEFEDYKTEDWSKPEMLQAQVITDMQDIFMKALNRSGWMNNVARLLSYSRLPKLHDGTPDGIDLPSKLEAHGISTAVLERIYANMVNLLGIANMGILVPAVLANNYDKGSYEYKNDDTWIDKFFPEVSTRNYKGKVFDIVQVGYTIEGVTEKKPVVQYN